MEAIDKDPSGSRPESWSKYREKHRLERISKLSGGIVLPSRVRIYSRGNHFILQWWDRSKGSTANMRIDGDLISAISKAREIEEKLDAFRSSGSSQRRIKLQELVERYLADLERRADVGEVAAASVRRFSSALAHLLRFTDDAAVAKSYPWSHQVDRDFRLRLCIFLQGPAQQPGKSKPKRPMRQPQFVIDACRAMFEWAADEQRGNCLPPGFVNPFLARKEAANQVRDALVGEPDITTAMAVDLIHACDDFQLRFIAPLILFGLRPSELTHVYCEHVDNEWFRVPCIPEMGYFTKGRRNKQFPMIPELNHLLAPSTRAEGGLLVRRRGRMEPSVSLQQQIDAFERECQRQNAGSAMHRERVRHEVLRREGYLHYDLMEGEFRKLAVSLKWPTSATLKDLRHLFSTCLENAGVPEFYRKYFMGQSSGRAPIVRYTHLNQIREHYNRLVRTEFSAIVTALTDRTAKLSPSGF